jgi:hypothetical protein
LLRKGARLLPASQDEEEQKRQEAIEARLHQWPGLAQWMANTDPAQVADTLAVLAGNFKKKWTAWTPDASESQEVWQLH